MTLRKKTLITIGSVLLCSVAIIYLILRALFLSSFLALEEQETRREAERARKALADELSRLSALAGDWAGWDDTYAFIEDANPEYIRSNLVDPTFSELGLNLMVFVHSSGRVVFAKGFDLEEEREVPLPAGLLAALVSDPESPLLRHRAGGNAEGLTGLLLLVEGPLLLVARPILTSEKAGPSRGTLIMGRYLDEAKVAQLADLTGLALAFQRLDEPALAPDLAAARTALLAEMEEAIPIVQRLDQERVAGYALLRDIYGQPALILKVSLPRTIYTQGLASLGYFMLALFATGLAFTAVTLLLLERGVLAKLARLTRAVREVSSSGELAVRIPLGGGDELASLASSINEMLARIKASQEEIRLLNQYLTSIIDNANVWLNVLDEKGNVVVWNRAAEQISGYSRDEVIGHGRIWEWQYPDPEYRARILAETAEIIQGRRTHEDFKTTIRRKNGELRTIAWRSRALTNLAGTPIGCITLGLDITEQERLERMKSEFFSTVSHELRTPLTSIKGYVDLLLAKETGALNPTQEEFLGVISRNADRLTKLVNDLLDIERLESGERKLELRDLALDEVLRDVAATFAVEAQKKGLTLEVELEEGLRVKGDGDYLGRAFANLLSNAIKYTKEGEVSLRARADGPAKEAVVEVADTGIGMTPEELARLFTRFFRSSNPYVREAVGTGLGLAIVKATIDRHGGAIEVESRPNLGTKFTVRLPLAEGWLKLEPEVELDHGPEDLDRRR